MKYTKKQYIQYLAGIILTPMGVVLTINSHAGAGGYDALNFAIAVKLGINTSLAIYMTAFLAVLITAGVRRGYPRLTTFISSFLLGLSTDVWNVVLRRIEGDTIVSSVIILLLGMVLVASGIAVYMHSGLPTNPTDDMIVAFKEKGIAIGTAKVCFDIICVVLAFILGGQIGWGTIIITLGLGWLIQWFYAVFGRIFSADKVNEHQEKRA